MTDAIGDAIRGSLEGLEGRDADPDAALSTVGGDEGDVSGGEAVAGEADTSGASGVDGSAEGVKPKAVAAKIEEVEDKLAKELGIDPKKNNPVPWPRVKAITTKREKDLVAKVAKLFGVDEATAATVSYDKIDEFFDTHYTKKKAERDAQFTSLEQERRVWQTVEDLAQNHPEKYLEELAIRVPFYRKFVLGGSGGTTDTGTKPRTQEEIEEAYPEPDVPLENGNATYSVGGLQKYVGVAVNKALKEARAELAALKKEYEPIVKEHKGRQISREAEDKIVQRVNYYKANWEGFAENEGEILDQFLKNPKDDIPGAYQAVMVRKHKERLAALEKERDAAKELGRKEAQEEIKRAKPVSTSVGSTAGEEKDVAVRSSDPLGDAIRQSIAGLKR